jgi:hypothetical protein
MMCVQVAPPAKRKSFSMVGEIVPAVKWEAMPNGFESQLFLQKKLKKLLTNRRVCDIIRVQKGRARRPNDRGAHESE